MKSSMIIKIALILLIITDNSLSEINKSVLERVRRFFESIPQPSTEYSSHDLERVQTDDVQKVQRFANSAAEVVKRLATILMFRNIYGVSYSTEQSFPQEIYKIGYIVALGKDREGRHIILIRSKRWRKSIDLYTLMKKFVLFQFEKVSLMKPYPDFLIIIDSTGLELVNIDKDIFDHNFSTMEQYAGPKTTILNLNIPEFLTDIKYSIKKAGSKSFVDRHIFINTEQLK